MRIQAKHTLPFSILSLGLLALTMSACGGPSQPPAPPPVMAAPAPLPAPPPSATTPPPAPAPAPTAAAPAEPPHHGHHHHPMMGMLVADLDQVGIKPEQKPAIDGIKANLEKLPEAAKEAHEQLVKDLADGAAAGKLDKTKIAADQKKLTQAAESSIAQVQDDANKLHKTLDAGQRKKLVELMRAKGKEMDEHMKGEMGEHEMGEHGPAGKPGEHEKGEHGHMGHHPMMDKLGEELGLTAAQKEKLKTKLDAVMKGEMGKMKEQHGAMQKQMKAIAEAFETEKFDAKKAGIGVHAADMVKKMTDSKIAFIESMLSVLTPEQRAKFAEHIRQHSDDES